MAAMKVMLRPWADGDLALLQGLLGDPAMMEHLGGPETAAQITARHDRYCLGSLTGIDPMFAIVLVPQNIAVGSIGYWAKAWQGEAVLETGWSILPAFQGRGIATSAARLITERASASQQYAALHAFPSVDNEASNAVCRKAGFVLQGAYDFEYPPGHWLRCNDWRFALR
ncbi:MAG: GNAT family N-acetyltransferase [Anaerolineales bacterium]|nr:GNAT family N-acetyltransferase [Anaerolineales bacterium]